MRHRLILLSVFMSTACPAQDVARDLSDYDFVTRTVAQDYSGWSVKTEGPAGQAIAAAREAGRDTVAEGAPGALRAAVDGWLKRFRDGHLSADWRDAAASPDRREDALGLVAVDDKTLLLRIPSFGIEHAERIRQIVDGNRERFAAHPFLVIDVRNNGGGGDDSFAPVIDLIYTRPITTVGTEFRSSPANIAAVRALAAQVAPQLPELAKRIGAAADRMAAVPGGWAPGDEAPFRITTRAAVMSSPAYVAVLVDGAASAAENFLLAARQSDKVTLMGARSSAGVVDYGDVLWREAPSGRFAIGVPVSRSLRVPHDPVDPHGIAPQVRVPEGWAGVLAAAQWLARRDALAVQDNAKPPVTDRRR